jgi:ATP-dependent Clp protease ATP-binding subunit ClpX
MFELPESNIKKLKVTRAYVEDKLDKSGITKLKAVS